MVHQRYLFSELEKMLIPQPAGTNKQTATADALHELAETIHKRSLVVILSDMMENTRKTEDIFAALQHLKHNRHEVILFHVIDKSKELDFEFENRPYRFKDVETGEELKVFPSRVKEQYTEAIKKFTSDLKLRCGQYHIDFVPADINQGFNQVLLPYLVKREKMS
jgi:hypothetical protein